MRSPCLGATAWILLLLAGCSSTPLPKGPEGAAPVETRSPTASSTSATSPSATSGAVAPQSRVATVDLGRSGSGAGGAAAPAPTAPAPAPSRPPVGGAALLAGERMVFFDFDSYVIKEEFKPLLDAQARQLASASGRRLTVEGHTDERGGREYNLALGQKRAEAVVKALTLLGVPAQQVEPVSFGKERPLAQGSDEAAWARNRRAELKDR